MNCIITGATKGIGRALAETFAEKGGNLALTARTAADLENLQNEFARRFPNSQVLIFPADLSQKNEGLAFANFVKNHWKQVHVLINNTGIFAQAPLLDEPDGLLEKMFQLNLAAAYHLTRAVLPMMLPQQSGHIFNICSVASRQAFPNSTAYTISKFALLGFTQSLRVELKDKGIKVTAVLPGATLTNSWTGVNIDPQRLIAPAEVAKAVWSAWEMSPGAVVEEIVIRPQLGDL
jgi:short-subunit dehydrogenase